MSEVNWDLAPEGADKLVESVLWGYLRWGNKLGQSWGSNSWFDSDEEYKTIATRPTQDKTVEDAVEYLEETSDGEWRSNYDNLHYDDVHHGWFYGAEPEPISTFICTREQFEACAAKKSEKWTHTYCDQKCRIIHTDAGASWIVIDKRGSEVVPANGLKPIKPTISESELLHKIKDMGKGVASDGHFGDTVRGWLDEYDII